VVAPWVGTYLADVGIADIVTNMTKLYFLTQAYDALSESLYAFGVLPKQVEHKAHSRLTAYTREFGELLNSSFK
jgi:hypothetical protein